VATDVRQPFDCIGTSLITCETFKYYNSGTLLLYIRKSSRSLPDAKSRLLRLNSIKTDSALTRSFGYLDFLWRPRKLVSRRGCQSPTAANGNGPKICDLQTITTAAVSLSLEDVPSTYNNASHLEWHAYQRVDRIHNLSNWQEYIHQVERHHPK
jgi:hypothetical protein